MRMRAEIQAFKIHRDLVTLLAKLQYIPTGQERLAADARKHRPSQDDLLLDMVLGLDR